MKIRCWMILLTVSLTSVLIFSCGPASDCSDTDEPCCGPYPDWQTSEYVLPYPVGKEYRLSQGNCPPKGWGHSVTVNGGAFRNSYDFDMPIGTPITACRAGVVTFARGNFRDGIDKNLDQANIVRIRGTDGLYDEYGHLMHQGVVVKVGDKIKQGQLIGYSGNTGWTGNFPHLHFHVSPREWPMLWAFWYDQPTKSTTFRNTRPNPQGLQTGEIYKALPYNESKTD